MLGLYRELYKRVCYCFILLWLLKQSLVDSYYLFAYNL